MKDPQVEPEAAAALGDVDRMQVAAEDISAQSRWAKVFLALIAGALVATPMAENSGTLVAILLVALVGVLSSERQRTGTSARTCPDSKVGKLALAGIIVLALAAYAGGIVLRDLADLSWGPLLTGAVLTAVILGATSGTPSEGR